MLKSKVSKILCGISILLLFSGCNPYAREIKCGKVAPFGSCGSTPEVYSEIINGPKNVGSTPNGEVVLNDCPDCGKEPKVPSADRQSIESAYQEALLGKASSLLKKTATPMVIPPTVGCIWFPPMLGENTDVINMEQYVCIMLDKARFIMGNYLNHTGE